MYIFVDRKETKCYKRKCRQYANIGGEEMTNTEVLNEKIDTSGLKREFIAKEMGISRFSLNKKIKNEVEFKATEIDCLCKLLKIVKLEDRWDIFFCEHVDKMPTL